MADKLLTEETSDGFFHNASNSSKINSNTLTISPSQNISAWIIGYNFKLINRDLINEADYMVAYIPSAKNRIFTADNFRLHDGVEIDSTNLKNIYKDTSGRLFGAPSFGTSAKKSLPFNDHPISLENDNFCVTYRILSSSLRVTASISFTGTGFHLLFYKQQKGTPIHVNTATGFKETEPYVLHNGVWTPATANRFDGTAWKDA